MVILVAEVPLPVVFTLFVATTAGVPSCLPAAVLPAVVVTCLDEAVTAGVVIFVVEVPDIFTITVPVCAPAAAVETGGIVAPLLLYVTDRVVCGLL